MTYPDPSIWTKPNALTELKGYQDPQNVHIVPETWREKRVAKIDRRQYRRRDLGPVAGLRWAFLWLFAVLGFFWFIRWAYEMIVFWVN
jgi:hypothetical protein